MVKTQMTETILLTGIITASIWLFFCIILEGKNRKYVTMAGIIIDIILFIICKNFEMLIVGLLGGLFFGLFGSGINARKYMTAVWELKSVKNVVITFIIFFVMVFMTIAIAFPGMEIEFR